VRFSSTLVQLKRNTTTNGFVESDDL